MAHRFGGERRSNARAAGIASAATNSSDSSADAAVTSVVTASAANATAAPNSAMPDPSTLHNGPAETLLTGDTASKVTAAAVAAQPGATIIRVETDSQGSVYEAHMKKADGSFVTLKFDASFKVTATQQGFGAGPAGPRPGASATPGA